MSSDVVTLSSGKFWWHQFTRSFTANLYAISLNYRGSWYSSVWNLGRSKINLLGTLEWNGSQCHWSVVIQLSRRVCVFFFFKLKWWLKFCRILECVLQGRMPGAALCRQELWSHCIACCCLCCQALRYSWDWCAGPWLTSSLLMQAGSDGYSGEPYLWPLLALCESLINWNECRGSWDCSLGFTGRLSLFL